MSARAAVSVEIPPLPRIYPQQPELTRLEEWEEAAACLGMVPFTWQVIAADYVMAVDENGRWLYPEAGVVVARQNGKTELLLPRVHVGLDDGESIIHTAQIRTLPRQMYLRMADHYETFHAELVESARRANGQEELRLWNGGRYAIVAAQRGARGTSNDTLIADEIREFEEFDVMAAARPTLTASDNPQVIYLSNAGHDSSVVLNDLKRRAEEANGDKLAYLEWSTPPEFAADDPEGWRFANPSPLVTDEQLRTAYETLPLPVFETEHLCRWVTAMAPRLVGEAVWLAARRAVTAPVRPHMAVSVDPSGTRASACLAWAQDGGTLALAVLADVTGSPIDLDRLGTDLAKRALELKVQSIGFDPWTDQHLVRHLVNARAVQGREYANASERFARLVESGRLAWADAEPVTADLPYTVRKLHDIGAWHAAKASEERPITASLAAIRAVWLAAAPAPPIPRVF